MREAVRELLLTTGGDVTGRMAARRLGCSSYRAMRRALQADGGATFAAMRQQIRMEMAAVMLCRDVRPKVIADLLGYSSANTLGRAFTTYTGVPPSRWRRHVLGQPC